MSVQDNLAKVVWKWAAPIAGLSALGLALFVPVLAVRLPRPPAEGGGRVVRGGG